MIRPEQLDVTPSLLEASLEFWSIYYAAILKNHTESGRSLQDPIRDRNLATTDSKHVSVFERFWRRQLARVLNVPESEVGPRSIQFRDHKKKAFDVCWPRTGQPRILISIKSMQNAFRNVTNRIEEAVGDSALLRMYKSDAVFGFFFFILNGSVAAGQAETGVSLRETGAKGVEPYLALIEEGGDFFDLSEAARYRKPAPVKQRKLRGRQNEILKAQLTLLDVLMSEPTQAPSFHYDAIAFAPTLIRRLPPDSTDSMGWEVKHSAVDERLNPKYFLSRLVTIARLRGFIE